LTSNANSIKYTAPNVIDIPAIENGSYENAEYLELPGLILDSAAMDEPVYLVENSDPGNFRLENLTCSKEGSLIRVAYYESIRPTVWSNLQKRMT